MLRIQELSKSYGTRVLFDEVSFAMTPGERLGLVGRNGSGKTTLLKLILGEEVPDQGSIERPKRYRVGHLSQHLEFAHPTILEEACSGLPVQEGGWTEDYLAEQALMGLGFSVEDFGRAPGELSGGFQVRLQLAKVLVSGPDLLLLDEPTNYLDIVTMRWLERYLRNWDGEVILITHDREFMDRVITHSMIIHRGKVRRVEGITGKLYDMLAQEEEIHEKTRLNQAKSRKDAERFVERFRYKASKAKQVQSRIKMLEKQGTMDELADIANLSFKFNAAEFKAHTLLSFEDLEFGYEDGPSLIRELSLAMEMGDRVAVVGKNGRGKSTLLNLIAGELKPRAGSFKRHPSVQMAHFGQTNIDRLHPEMTVEEEIIAALPDHSLGAARAICGLMMFSGDDALKRVEVLSGGERARVLLGKLLVSPANLVLLDEPTNHLDMESIDSLTEALQVFPGGVLIVTHNERVLHALATRLVVFDRGRVSIFDGTYEDFLDRVGWSEEDAERKPKQAAKGGGKRKGKQQRKTKGPSPRDQRKRLQQLQREFGELEEAICKTEAELAAVDRQLEAAAQSGDRAEITRLSEASADLRGKIDADFAALEKVTESHDQLAAELQDAE